MALALPSGMCGSRSAFPVLCGGKGVGTPFWQQRNLDQRRAQGINPAADPTQVFPTPNSSQFLMWSRACIGWNEDRSVGSSWLCQCGWGSVFPWDELNTSVRPKP